MYGPNILKSVDAMKIKRNDYYCALFTKHYVFP